jgi:hypothetical protein
MVIELKYIICCNLVIYLLTPKGPLVPPGDKPILGCVI